MPVPDEQQLLEDIAHARGEAKSLESLYALYGLKGRTRVALRRLLTRLVADGRLVRLRPASHFGLPRSRETVEGVVAGTTQGFAFVAVSDASSPDVFIRESHLHGAMHGDRVRVAYLPDSDPGRPSGEIVDVVERRASRIVGLFVEGDPRHGVPNRLRPFDQRISTQVVIPDRFSLDAEDGVFVDAVLLHEARDAARRDEPLPARVVAILGRPEEPGTDVRVVMRSFDLADAHSPEAVAEAERRAAAPISAEELARRRDLRGLRTVTIDGETARDFDDAISVERRGAVTRLHVHIADVSAYVIEGTPLDAEALARGTSVYFPDRAVHMLPECLAAGACSLRPGEDRLAVTVRMDFDAQGRIVASESCESVIRSDRRMTYTEMRSLLVERDAVLRDKHGAFLEDFDLMADLAGKLIAARAARGGLDFDLPIPMLKIDDDGLVTEIVESERNVAHRIIEEFMIAANECVARELFVQREPTVYRNHEPPAPTKVAAFRDAAKAFGHDLGGGDAPETVHFQRVLHAAQGRPEEPLLTTLVLRTMSLARYGVDCLGHFGLALREYTHFTSPIRRYPDLLFHRALKRRLHGERIDADDAEEVRAELAELADRCSRAERNAEAAERTLVEWKKAVFMRDRVGESFDGRITGMTDRGLFVTLVAHHVEGFVKFKDLARDWYDHDATRQRIVGRDTGRSLRLGDALRVVVVQVDVFRRRITLAEVSS